MDTRRSKRVELKFPQKLIEKPIICELVKKFGIDFNIQKAEINDYTGWVILDLTGTKDDYTKAIDYLKEIGINIKPLSKVIKRNDVKCTHCGACVMICPTKAFIVEQDTRKILFNANNCIACEHCIKICPPRAMEIDY